MKIFVILFVTLQTCSAHLVLTFPPARKYALDFLDNFRTSAPCGVPRGFGPVTEFKAGSQVKVTWHLAYPHQGGFYLQVLDKSNREVVRYQQNGVVMSSPGSVPEPTGEPEGEPTAEPAGEPTAEPAGEPTAEPAGGPTTEPAGEPTAEPTGEPTTEHAGEPTAEPAGEPTTEPAGEPTAEPAGEPTAEPAGDPTAEPAGEPTAEPAGEPTAETGTNTGGTVDLIGYNDTTMVEYTITLPDIECDGCTLRMIRQALEWGSCASQYLFWSCADINIVKDNNTDPKTNCSGQGTWKDGLCSCNQLYKGDRCQYKDDCEIDSDCGGHGQCEDTQATSYPRFQCYCDVGWFGKNCKQESKVTTTNIDYSQYEMRTLSPEYELYYREITAEQELEVVMKVKSSTWVGIGWKPTDFRSGCQSFPNFPGAQPNTNAEPESEAEPESTSEPEHEAEPESTSEPEHTAEPESTSEPEHTAEPESTSEPEHEAQPESTSEPEHTAEPESTSEPEQEPEPESTSEPEHTAEPESTSEPEHTAEPESTSEPEHTAEPESTSGLALPSCTIRASSFTGGTPNPEPSAESEPSAEGEPSAEAEPRPEGEPTPESETRPGGSGVVTRGNKDGSGTHPMDCTDMVIGSARGMRSRVGDYYTRDRSTPQHDDFYGGTNSLTAALGFEENGYTVILFRKKLTATERTDYSIDEVPMSVIWARGQDSGMYVHIPRSGLEAGKAANPKYYNEDELKYHGHRPNRGAATINFREKTKLPTGCIGQWPATCNNCPYQVTWVVDVANDMVNFTITARLNGARRWIGLGFSPNGRMTSSDAVIGWVDGSDVHISDRFITGYSPPQIDTADNLVDKSGKLTNGVTEIKFSRKRNTGQPQDFTFTDADTGCPFLLFPVGGTYDSSSLAIFQHATTPQVSAQRICFSSTCAGSGGNGAPQPSLKYVASLRFLTLQYSSQYANKSSDAFRNLKGLLEREMSKLSKPGTIDTIEVVNIRSGSVIADFQVSSNTTNEETLKGDTETLFKSIQANGRVGDYAVDPAYLIVENADQEDTSFEFLASLRFPDLTYAPDYANKMSTVFMLLKNKLDNEMQALLKPSTIKSIEVIKLRNGSIIADFLVKSTSSAANNETFQDDVINFFKSIRIIGNVAGYAVDPIYPIVEDISSQEERPAMPEGCMGQWPAVCDNCSYQVKWVVDVANDVVNFTITARLEGQKKWIGLGFSPTGRMSNSDAVIGWVDDSDFYISDRYIVGYSPPAIDTEDNLFDKRGTVQNGVTEIKFSRPRNTSQIQDFTFTDTDCPYLLFPVGGDYNTGDKSVSKHATTPSVSAQRICFSSTCARKEPRPSYEFVVSLRFPSLQYSPEYANKMSTVYLLLKNSFDKEMQGFPKPKSINSIEVINLRNGSIIADLLVKSSSNATNNETFQGDVLSFFKSVQVVGNVGGYSIDPSYPLVKSDDPPEERPAMPEGCMGQWPAVCDNCSYQVKWVVDVANDVVNFTITARLEGQKKWIGLGFSPTGRMSNSDAVIGWVDDSDFYISDRYIVGYSPPAIDTEDNLFDKRGTVQNGVTEIKFSRPRNTSQIQDFTFTDTDCPYLLFPVGGDYNTGDKSVSKHATTPSVSAQRICFSSTCARKEPRPSYEFVVSLRFPSLQYSPEYANKMSTVYLLLKNSFDKEMQGFPKPKSINSIEVINLRNGSIIADLLVKSSSNATNNETFQGDVLSFFKSVQVVGNVGGYSIDPSYPLVKSDDPPEERPAMPEGCMGQWPAVCDNCSYQVKWVVDVANDVVNFTITARLEGQKKWIGLGFSPTGRMSNSDAVIGWVDDSDFYISDRYIVGYSPPAIDTEDNLFDKRGTVQNGVTEIKFSRPRNTSQIQDFTFTDTDCPYLLFPVGGDYNTGDKSVSKHATTPSVSAQRICFSSTCARKEPRPSYEFVVSLRFPSLQYSPEYANKMSTVYLLLKNSFDKEMQGFPKPKSINSIEVINLRNGSIIADLLVKSSSNATNNETFQGDVLSFFKSVQVVGNVGGYSIDPSYPLVKSDDPPEERPAMPEGCMGQWPAVCDNCSYQVKWVVDVANDVVNFTITARLEGQKKWIGLGFSPTGRMSNSDAVIGWVDDSDFYISDRYIVGFSSPAIDAEDNLFDKRGTVQNGVTEIKFSRPRNTSQIQDFTFTDTDCPYLLFPVGGDYNTGDKSVSKHATTPSVSAQRICFSSTCARKEPRPSYEFVVSLRFPSLQYSPEYANKMSTVYLLLKNSFDKEMQGFPKPKSINSIEVINLRNGSIIADLLVKSSSNATNNETFQGDVLSFFKSVQVVGNVGGYSIDPSYPLVKSDDPPERPAMPEGCMGQWPAVCDNCSYQVKWVVDVANDVVNFTITARLEGQKKWIGLGFSPTGRMSNSDAVIGWVDDSDFYISDRYIVGYSPPAIDTEDNLFDKRGTVQNGVTEIRFSRPRNTSQIQDFTFTDTDCPYLLFPVGGDYNTGDKSVSKHATTPSVSAQKICFSSACARQEPRPSYEFVVSLRFPSLQYSPEYANKMSTVYLLLKNSFDKEMQGFPKPKSINSIEVINLRNGSIIADFLVKSSSNATNNETFQGDVLSFFKSVQVVGNVGGYSIDPSYPLVKSDDPPEERPAMPEGCMGQWPAVCNSCRYQVKWVVDVANDVVNFTITARLEGQKKWIGLGFSPTGRMGSSDAVIGWVDGSSVYVSDRHIIGYNPPALDAEQDLLDTRGTFNDGVTEIMFSRKRNTGRDDDFTFTDTDCPYLLFPVGGGYNTADKSISKHDTTPQVSAQRICFSSKCGSNATRPTFEFTASLRLTNLQYTSDYANKLSNVFRLLKSQLDKEMDALPKPSTIKQIEVIKLREGSVIADFLVTPSTESNLTFQEDSLKFFKSVQTVGSVAGHNLDTSYPIVKGDVQPVEVVKEEAAPDPAPARDHVVAIIVCISVVLCFLGVVVTIYKIVEMRNKKLSSKEKPRHEDRIKLDPREERPYIKDAYLPHARRNSPRTTYSHFMPYIAGNARKHDDRRVINDVYVP
ncbi:uncharacterized protein [Haliotis cracherodii]|uniref:uncharacterized protein isoform X2 n=1 Tax=Haliotis cracherodii TaxID=6455 RepID=UPI0039E9650E